MAFKGVIPAPKAVPSPFGLFGVADVTRPGAGDEHWAGGFSQETELCSFDASVVDVCGGPDIPVVVADGDLFGEVQPFGIKAVDECLTPGWNVQDRRARVLRQLELVTQKAVERELWNGTYALQAENTNSYLSKDGAAALVSADVISVRTGLALLQQAFANCGAGTQGIVHMTKSTAEILGDSLSLDRDKGDAFTRGGNLVAIGNGYDGRGPGDLLPPTDPLIVWMYMTGPVAVRLGPAEMVTPSEVEALDARTNVMRYVALRPASVTWDGCCHFAVQVDLRLSRDSGETADAAVVNGEATTYSTVGPTITAVTPNTGAAAGGTVVTITGTDLWNTSGVTFGGSAGTALVVHSDTSLTVTTPAHATGAVAVVVTTTGGTDTEAGGFTYA